MTLGRILAALGTATGVSLLLAFAVGVEPVFAIAWGILVGILVLATQLAIPDEPRVDSPEIPAGPERRGTAISRMAWSLNPRTGMAGELITRRVRGTLSHRLKRYGLDTENPHHRGQIDERIGDEIWARLTGPGTTRNDIERALDAIDGLSPNKEKL